MKYCTSNYQQETYRKKVQELRFNIKNINGALNFLESEQHADYRVILEIPDIYDINMPFDKLIALAKEDRRIVLDLYKLEDLIKIAKASEYKCSYMYHYQVITWALVQILSYYKVSDILIGEPLTFEMDKVKQTIKEEKGINVRICPHLGRQIADSVDDGVKHFWILPQHISLYEDTVDVCDLLDNNTVRESALIDAYTSNKPYLLPMNLLFSNFDKEIPSNRIDIDLIRRRKNCGQKCMVNDRVCHSCDLYARFAEVVPKKES